MILNQSGLDAVPTFTLVRYKIQLERVSFIDAFKLCAV